MSKQDNKLLQRVREAKTIRYPQRCDHVQCERFSRCEGRRKQMEACDDYICYRWRRTRALFVPHELLRLPRCKNCFYIERAEERDGALYCKAGKKNVEAMTVCRRWEKG